MLKLAISWQPPLGPRPLRHQALFLYLAFSLSPLNTTFLSTGVPTMEQLHLCWFWVQESVKSQNQEHNLGTQTLMQTLMGPWLATPHVKLNFLICKMKKSIYLRGSFGYERDHIWKKLNTRSST